MTLAQWPLLSSDPVLNWREGQIVSRPQGTVPRRAWLSPKCEVVQTWGWGGHCPYKFIYLLRAERERHDGPA